MKERDTLRNRAFAAIKATRWVPQQATRVEMNEQALSHWYRRPSR